MTQQQHALDISGVSVSYGRVRALKSVDLNINRGESFGLIGLNGAGKTSLMKTIIGLRTPDTGTVKVFEENPEKKAARRNFAFLPERFEPPWFMTGYEFIKFSSRLYGRTTHKESIHHASEKLGLDVSALKRRVQTYSKGMRQKVGLMAVVLAGCDLLILDEPMSGLDPLARTAVKDMLLSCKAQGRTIFLSSHILADMDEICDRVGVLHEGEIKFTGTPEKLKQLTACANLERAFLQYIEKKEAA